MLIDPITFHLMYLKLKPSFDGLWLGIRSNRLFIVSFLFGSVCPGAPHPVFDLLLDPR